MDDFVNLHVHTYSSLQDSIIRPEGLIKQVEAYNQEAVAITDHASVASWIVVNDLCKDSSVKPIFGNEFYCIPEYIKSRRRDHLVLLAMNQEGLINIRRLQRIAVENSYYKPLLSYKKIEELPHNGIYCTSACSLSSISKCILAGNMDSAGEFCEYFNQLFDGNFSLELQFHPEYKDQSIINHALVELSDKYDIPLTVSCDSHFLNEDDKPLRKIIQAIAWKKKWNDKDLHDSLKSNCIGNSDLIKQFAIESNFQYMHVVQKAIKQTNKIASMCNAKLEEPQRRIPIFNKYDEFNELMSVQEW